MVLPHYYLFSINLIFCVPQIIAFNSKNRIVVVLKRKKVLNDFFEETSVCKKIIDFENTSNQIKIKLDKINIPSGQRSNSYSCWFQNNGVTSLFARSSPKWLLNKNLLYSEAAMTNKKKLWGHQNTSAVVGVLDLRCKKKTVFCVFLMIGELLQSWFLWRNKHHLWRFIWVETILFSLLNICVRVVTSDANCFFLHQRSGWAPPFRFSTRISLFLSI